MARKQRKVQYKLDLVQIFQRAYAGTELQKKNQLRAFISEPSLKLNYGRHVIDEIRARTSSSIDKKSNPFKKYSKTYMKSDIFKIFGKSPKVDMTLSGEMMASMIPVPRFTKTEVIIEFADDQNDKAHGHVNGSKLLPKRDFFGLPKEVEERILVTLINDAARSSFLGIVEQFIGDVDIPLTTALLTIEKKEDL